MVVCNCRGVGHGEGFNAARRGMFLLEAMLFPPGRCNTCEFSPVDCSLFGPEEAYKGYMVGLVVMATCLG